jgi:phage replication O-like protein O
MTSGIQVDDGDFTRLHNTILEKLALARFTASEYRCLMFLFRSTYGWQKKEDVISLSQWAAGVGIDTEKRHNVLRTLQSLVTKRVIYTKPHGTSVISPDNKTVISPDNHKRKKERLKKEESAAEPPHPAVVIFREVWKRNPNKPAMQAISERVTDLVLWREACVAWGVKGHKPTNVDGMLDWYDHPERFRTPYKPPNYQNGAGPPITDERKSAIATAAKLARQSIRTAEQFGGKIDPSWSKAIETAKEYGV